MKITIAVSRIKRFDRHCDQKIALTRVADALAFRRVAYALGLMQRMRHVVSKRTLFQDPLAVGNRKRGECGEQESGQDFLIHKWCLELNRNRQKGGPKCPGSHNGYWRVCGSDAMNLLALILLIESHNPQDWRQNHPWAMDPSHSLVEPDRPASFGSWHSGRADCIVSSNEIQISRQPAESRVQVARRCAGALASGVERGGDSGNQRNGRDQAHPLMNLQHVRSLVEQGLLAGVSLSLLRRKAQIRQCRRRPADGWSIWQVLLRHL